MLKRLVYLVLDVREWPSTLGGPCRIEQNCVEYLLCLASQVRRRAAPHGRSGGRAGRPFAPPSRQGVASRRHGAASAPSLNTQDP